MKQRFLQECAVVAALTATWIALAATAGIPRLQQPSEAAEAAISFEESLRAVDPFRSYVLPAPRTGQNGAWRP